ncbi:MAG: hypothetical protein HGB11_10420 [Chlorobiales bacterium]|nr:hypothetical protein [Chlorobiales bacterium]
MDIRINQTFDEILAAYSKSEFEGMAEMLTANLNQGKSLSIGSDFSLPLRPIFLTIDQYRAIREASFYLGSAVRKIAKALIKEGVACLTDFGWRACQLRAAIARMGAGG